MKKQILFGVLLLLISGGLFAQITVTGTVFDEGGVAVIGATVKELGTDKGTITDIDGKYSLSVSDENAILQFSFIGLKSETQVVGQQREIDMILREDAEVLSEVVVTALGFEENQDELGYANSRISAQTITEAAEPNVINSLSGKASGVRITRNSGDPGAGAYIQIRGISTIDRDAQPLIVVDGVPISNASRGVQSSIGAQSRLNDINPNDIESIDVLKGASAAALWGTRALGGVIVIKTKSGKYNQKTTVNYKSTFSVDQITGRYPQQTRFGQGSGGVYSPTARDSWGDRISDRSGGPDVFNTSGEFFIDQTGNIYYPVEEKNSQTLYNDQNFDQIFQNGQFWENNVSVSGGNDYSTIFVSMSDMNQQGIIRNNSDYRRTTFRANAGFRFSDKVKLNVTSTYAKTTSNRIRRGASSSGLHLGLLRSPVDFDQTGYRGDYFAGPEAAPISNRQRSYRRYLGSRQSAIYNNPLWTINEQENLVNVDRFITNAELTVSPTNWLDLIGRVGLDQFSEWNQQFFTPGSAAGAFRQGRFDKELARNTIFNMDYIAKAGTRLTKNITGSVLLGFNYNNRQLLTEGNQISDFIQFADVAGGIRDINNALPENRVGQSTFGQERTVGVYTSANLAFYDMIFVNGTLRGESASTFGDMGDNTFYFPSTSIAWQFTKLKGLESSMLSFGKLRFSYGEVGVQPGRYNTSNIFIARSFSDPLGGGLGSSLYGNGSFVPSSQRGSRNLRPERKRETEFGLDLRFFKDKLSFSGTYYTNTTSDMLLDFPIANSRGLARIYTNGAELENQGVELDLGYNIINGKDWSWNMNFIFTAVRNNVSRLDQGLTINLGGLNAVNSRALEGQPVGVLWGSRSLRDDDGNVVLDENGFPVQDQVEGVIGDPNPDWQGSIFSTVRYKNFSLSVLFETFQGADIWAGTKSVMTDLGTWGATGVESTANQNLLDYNGDVILAGETFRGRIGDFGGGPVALSQPWYNGDGGFFGGGNHELYIEDGSWSRIREIVFTYTARSPWLQRTLGLSSLDISVTGRNLFIWSNFEGNDPDTNFSGVSKARGIDYFNNPATKSYIFTLSATF